MPTNTIYAKNIPDWLVADSAVISAIPKNIGQWLLDDTSLTLRVKNYCTEHDLGLFSVKVLSQGICQPSSDEIKGLKLNNEQDALIREVLLYGGESPLIYARTVIPSQTLTGEQKVLGELGNRPLGEFLFSQPDLERDDMEVASLKQGQQLFDSAISHLKSNPGEIWARRSVFRLKHKPLLVAEVFLPDILKYLPNQHSTSSSVSR